MHRIVRITFVLCTLLVFAAQALAADSGNYVVLPFKINGPSGFGYLEKAVPSMLSSRLYWQGHFQPVGEGATALPGSVEAVRKAQAAVKADFAVWGEVTIVGDDASIDVRVLKKDGKEWRKSSKARVNDLIASLQGTADAINAEVFGRAGGRAPAAGRQLNPEMVHNEATQQQVYLNPQFRYQGGDGSRLRTQSLPFASVGMAVQDVTGDGKNEVVLLGEHKVAVYRWNDARLDLLGEYQLPRSQQALLVRTIDINRDKAHEIVVTTYDEDYTEPFSYVLSFKDGVFKEVATRIKGYLNVVKLPPDYRPVLIGQKGDPQWIFSRQGAYEMMKQGDTFVFSRKIELPKGANALNFTWLPDNSKGEGERLVVLNSDEKLQVFGAKGTSIYTSSESFSGASVGITEQTNMPGLGKGGDVIPGTYYVPLRMIATDMDKNKDWELLVNKPVSMASQFFDRYRSFPEGEIQSLFWDGVGMSMQWKTRRIKGTVTDFDLNDVNNDGIPDLVVCVNTHPGALGLQNRKTMVVAYPLDMEKADPNTPPVIEQ